jgi:PIN domain nuclease of toxin-antitoxin system
VKLLLDTHVLLWAAGDPSKLSRKTRALLSATDNALLFSVASLWEITIKRRLGRADFRVDARLLRRGLFDNGYSEIGIASAHVVAIDSLPDIHRDPFDRLLIAQARVEGVALLTSDNMVLRYGEPSVKA